jgi:hypothetical protein
MKNRPCRLDSKDVQTAHQRSAAPGDSSIRLRASRRSVRSQPGSAFFEGCAPTSQFWPWIINVNEKRASTFT